MKAPKNTRMEEAATGKSGYSWSKRARRATGNGAAAAPRPQAPARAPSPRAGPASLVLRHFRPSGRAKKGPRVVAVADQVCGGLFSSPPHTMEESVRIISLLLT